MKFGDLLAFVSLCLLACAVTAEAQSVLESTPSAPLIPPSLRDASDSSPFALPASPLAISSPLRWGPVDIKPYLSDKFIYSDGIQAAPGHPTNSYINSLSGGLLVDLGTHWTFDYTPTWMVYTNREFQNSVNQALNLAGGAQFGDWLAQFSQTYSSTDAPLIETGRQTKQQTSATTLGVSHRFNDHWSFAVNGVQNLQFIDASPDNYDWSATGQLAYLAGTKLEISLSYRLGFTDFDPGTYMTYVQPQAEIRWRLAKKLVLAVQVGREQSQIHKTGVAGQNTPTWNASAQYQPFDHTTLTLGASRSVSPSTLMNSISNSQGWNVALSQRLLGHLVLDASLSGEKTHFFGTNTVYIPAFSQEDVVDATGNVIGTVTTVTYTPSTVIDLRNDSTRTFNLRLSISVLKHGTFAVTYDRTRNASDAAGFGFTSHQIGCEVGYHW